MSTKAKKSKSTITGHLSPREVKALLKPRDGFDTFAAQLMALSRAKPGLLTIKGVDPAAILQQLAEYDELEPVESSAKDEYLQAHEGRLVRASNIWRAMMAVYKRAKAIGQTDEDVLHAITDFEQFMKVGRRKKAVPATP